MFWRGQADVYFASWASTRKWPTINYSIGYFSPPIGLEGNPGVYGNQGCIQRPDFGFRSLLLEAPIDFQHL